MDQILLVYANDVYKLSDSHRIDVLRMGLAGWVVENMLAALIPSTHADPRWRLLPWEIDGAGSHSAISVPLVDHRPVLGVLTLAHSEPRRFGGQDLVVLTAIADMDWIRI